MKQAEFEQLTARLHATWPNMRPLDDHTRRAWYQALRPYRADTLDRVLDGLVAEGREYPPVLPTLAAAAAKADQRNMPTDEAPSCIAHDRDLREAHRRADTDETTVRDLLASGAVTVRRSCEGTGWTVARAESGRDYAEPCPCPHGDAHRARTRHSAAPPPPDDPTEGRHP